MSSSTRYLQMVSHRNSVRPFSTSSLLLAFSHLMSFFLLRRIQNSIDDLFSLFEFLGKGTVGPYYEYGVFKEKISKLIKSKNEKSVEVAMARLRVSSCFSSLVLCSIVKTSTDYCVCVVFVAYSCCCYVEKE